jgi:predicted phage terminase large subunit-like protein
MNMTNSGRKNITNKAKRQLRCKRVLSESETRRIIQKATQSDRTLGFKLFAYRAIKTINPDGIELPSTKHLDFFYHLSAEVVAGRAKRCLINVPPKHFKTLIFSICLPAYELALRPQTSILVVCHTDRLAVDIVTAIRKVVDSEWFKSQYPTTRIAKGDARREDFKTSAGGGVRAISIYSGITGFSANLIILDDPNDIADAAYPSRLSKVNGRFDAVIRSRLINPARDRIIVIQQRLHLEDLTGHLLKEGQWDHLSLPFLAEENEDFFFLGKRWCRPPGQVLWPKAYSTIEVDRIKRSPTFQSLYQQRPGRNAFGLTIEHFPTYKEVPFGSGVVLSIDPASSSKGHGSFAVIMAFLSNRGCEYLIDLWRAHAGPTEIRTQAVRMIRRHNASLVLVENSGIGPALASDLGELTGVAIECPMPRMNKVGRFQKILHWIEQRRVAIPRDVKWLSDFLDEVLTFPSGDSDDQVDCLVQNLLWKDENPPPPYRQSKRVLGVALTRMDYRPDWHRPDHIYVWPRRRGL